jgi:integrase
MIKDISVTRSQDKIHQYVEYCRQRGQSLTTLTAKHMVLSKIDRECGLFQAKPHDIQDWLDRDLQPVTAQVYLNHIRSFYAWILETEGLPNPAARLKTPKVQRKDPQPINPKDLDLALETASARMRAWLLLGAAAGLRCLEIAQLKPRDIHLEDLDNPWLHIPAGKGGKSRKIPLHLEVVKALIVLPWPIKGKMWPTLTASSISYRINYHLRRCNSPATAHKLRHYAATNYWAALCEAGTPDILVLTDFLGHSSPVTSMIYTKPNAQKGAAAMKHMKVGQRAQEIACDPASRL